MKDIEEAIVDVLMGTYNGARHLTEQMTSLQAQTYKNWRLYVRDDCSSDSTLAVLQEIVRTDSRVVLVKDEKGNVGFNANYELLLGASRSNYIMFCDQDDKWDIEKIRKTLTCMKENEVNGFDSPILVHCEATIVDAHLVTLAKSFIGARGRLNGLPSVLMANPAQGASMMMNRPLVDLMMRYPARLPYDYKAALIAEATGHRYFLSEPLLLYRQHESNAIGAASRPEHASPTIRSDISPTLKLGLDAAPCIEATLLEVKEHWHPRTEKLLSSHMEFVKPGFSLPNLAWIAVHRYGFYRRADYVYAVLHTLGLRFFVNW